MYLFEYKFIKTNYLEKKESKAINNIIGFKMERIKK
jgi:hypothetical protein